MATHSCHVTVKRTRNRKDSFSRQCAVFVFTIVLTSLFGLSLGVYDANEEHVPTLKEIFGSIPQNSVPLMHRHSLNFPLPRSTSEESEANSSRPGPSQSMFQNLRRSLRRKSTWSSPNALEGQVSDVGFRPYFSRRSQYYVKLQIGTPVQDVLLLMDTGSAITWIQSKYCETCYPEILPRYDSNVSLTFDPQDINGSRFEMTFSQTYADGSNVYGPIVSDTLTIDSGYGNRVVIPNFEFLLGENSRGLFAQGSGILGLNLRPKRVTPLLTQLGEIDNGTYSIFSKKFRHCFPDRVKQANATSFLSFGDISESDTNSLFSSGKHLYENKTLWTAIVPTEGNLSSPIIGFYALNLTAISVAGNRIEINPTELTLESALNRTRTIVDSGTPITRLREPYYSQFVLAYYNSSLNLGANLSDEFDDRFLYYNISKDAFDAMMFPSVSFIFQKWQLEGVQEEEEIEIFQPKDNLIIPTSQNEDSTDVYYILNVLKAESDSINIIGNYAQQNFLVEYDLQKRRVGFLRASCAFEY